MSHSDDSVVSTPAARAKDDGGGMVRAGAHGETTALPHGAGIFFARLWRRFGRQELAILLSLLSVFGALLFLVWLTGEVLEGDTHVFDEAVLLSLRSSGNPADPLGPRWL